jgi:hypothetical protein
MHTETTGGAVIVLLTAASRWRDEVHCTESAEEPSNVLSSNQSRKVAANDPLKLAWLNQVRTLAEIMALPNGPRRRLGWAGSESTAMLSL